MSQVTAPDADARPLDRNRVVQRAGLVAGAFVAAFLLFDAVIHILRIEAVVESERTLGYPTGSMAWLGALELACLVLYVVPRTRVLGAVLLTGYLGGAMSAQVRVEAPLFSTLLFPVYMGVLVWAGAWATEPRVRELLPFRRPA